MRSGGTPKALSGGEQRGRVRAATDDDDDEDVVVTMDARSKEGNLNG